MLTTYLCGNTLIFAALTKCLVYVFEFVNGPIVQVPKSLNKRHFLPVSLFNNIVRRFSFRSFRRISVRGQHVSFDQRIVRRFWRHRCNTARLDGRRGPNCWHGPTLLRLRLGLLQLLLLYWRGGCAVDECCGLTRGEKWSCLNVGTWVESYRGSCGSLQLHLKKFVTKTHSTFFCTDSLLKWYHRCHHLVTPYRVPFHRALWKVNKAEHLNNKT